MVWESYFIDFVEVEQWFFTGDFYKNHLENLWKKNNDCVTPAQLSQNLSEWVPQIHSKKKKFSKQL